VALLPLLLGSDPVSDNVSPLRRPIALSMHWAGG
jgi:hypothetical protein